MNINNSNYSIEDALLGLNRVTTSDWALFGRAKLSNTYIHATRAVVPDRYINYHDANNINGYTLGGMVGIGGTFVINNFYIASDFSIGAGPTYTSWSDQSGKNEKYGYSFMNSHIFDLAFGYSEDKLSLLMKISTMSDVLKTNKMDVQNLSTSTDLIFTYRF